MADVAKVVNELADRVTTLAITGGSGAGGVQGPPGPPGDQGPVGAAAIRVSIIKDLGAGASSGHFDITGLSGLTVGKDVDVRQTAQPIASKGNATDEPELDSIVATGIVTSASTIRVYWRATSVVVGEYAFSYAAGA
jgi:hypothetical protein